MLRQGEHCRSKLNDGDRNYLALYKFRVAPVDSKVAYKLVVNSCACDPFLLIMQALQHQNCSQPDMCKVQVWLAIDHGLRGAVYTRVQLING